jgi:tetratricopeptide (TPR) repeat protein
VRAGRLLLAAALVALAVVAGLLAHAAGAWDERLSDDDARFLAGERVAWTVDAPLSGAAERLVALGDDLDARRALALHRRAQGEGADFGSGQERQGVRSAAEAALAEVARATDGSPSAQASVLLGTLLFEDTGAPEGPTPAEQALGAFGNALAADPDDAEAAYDLELLLRLLEARGERPGVNPGAGATGGGRRGAGGGTPGRGY